jgi:hypothetical protein
MAYVALRLCVKTMVKGPDEKQRLILARNVSKIFAETIFFGLVSEIALYFQECITCQAKLHQLRDTEQRLIIK